MRGRIARDVFTGTGEVQGDKLIVPEKPGLGVKLDLDYLKAHEVDG